jgi:hypothetical protein
MQDYPLDLSFKIFTIGTRVGVVDASGRQVAYVRKKKFRLREDVMVYRDEGQREALFRLQADRVWDFGASYAVTAPDGRLLGRVRRQGVRSLWRSAYAIADAGGKEIGGIREENPWVKVADGLLEMIPFADALDGLFFNPAYRVDLRGETVLRLQKQRALLESRFRLEKLGDFRGEDENLLLASVVMMLLLERERG